MVVRFAHALIGMGKIRMSEVNDKKNLIQQCAYAFHMREQNKDMWRSTEDFMTAVLCSPVDFEEFKNPEYHNIATRCKRRWLVHSRRKELR